MPARCLFCIVKVEQQDPRFTIGFAFLRRQRRSTKKQTNDKDKQCTGNDASNCDVCARNASVDSNNVSSSSTSSRRQTASIDVGRGALNVGVMSAVDVDNDALGGTVASSSTKSK